MTKQQQRWTLAVDIERSGAFDIHDTMAIGAAVRDADGKELDRFVYKAYVPGECVFEERCKVEFWDNEPEALEACKYTGPPKPKAEREIEMIEGLHAFRKSWEENAAALKIRLDFVSDNAVYDFGFINQLYFKYMPAVAPIPYSASIDPKKKTQVFWGAWETHSMQRGFLMATDPEFALNNEWGYTKRIAELYDVPDDPVKHDHEPDNDASTIALENAVLLGIASGKFKRRKLAGDVATK